VIEGAVQRIRPKIMTVCAILFGLLPIMWSPVTQAGADVMKRIAAPMIGGVITSAVLELLLYPTIYILWRRRHLPEPDAADVSRLNVRLSWPLRRAARWPWIALIVLIGRRLAVTTFGRAAVANHRRWRQTCWARRLRPARSTASP